MLLPDTVHSMANPTALVRDVSTALDRFAPVVARAIVAQHEALWLDMDATLVELCRQRIRLMQTGTSGPIAPEAAAAGLTLATVDALSAWPSSPLFNAAQRACLAYTEQFVGDVAGMTEAETGPVLEHLGAGGLYALTNALLVMDQHQRITLSLGRIFGPGGDA